MGENIQYYSLVSLQATLRGKRDRRTAAEVREAAELKALQESAPLRVSRRTELIIAGRRPKADPDAALKRAFKQFDTDGDGLPLF